MVDMVGSLSAAFGLLLVGDALVFGVPVERHVVGKGVFEGHRLGLGGARQTGPAECPDQEPQRHVERIRPAARRAARPAAQAQLAAEASRLPVSSCDSTPKGIRSSAS